MGIRENPDEDSICGAVGADGKLYQVKVKKRRQVDKNEGRKGKDQFVMKKCVSLAILVAKLSKERDKLKA